MQLAAVEDHDLLPPVAAHIRHIQPIRLLRQPQDELPGERLEQPHVAALVSLLGTGQLVRFTGPVNRVDDFHALGRPSGRGNPIHLVLKHNLARGVEHERLLVLVVAGPAPHEDLLRTRLEPPDSGILRLLLPQVLPPDRPVDAHNLHLVRAFLQQHNFQPRFLGPHVGHEHAVNVSPKLGGSTSLLAVRPEDRGPQHFVPPIAIQVGQASTVVGARHERIGRPERLSAISQGLERISRKVASHAVTVLVRGLQQDVSVALSRKLATNANSHRSAPFGTGGLALASSLPVAPSTTCSTPSFVKKITSHLPSPSTSPAATPGPW